MYFNINSYSGEYCMHCDTLDEAREFCRVMRNCYNQPYELTTGYSDCEVVRTWDKNTLYYFNEGLVGCLPVKNTSITVLEWSNFSDCAFLKEELKDGDMLQLRNGIICVAIPTAGFAVCSDGKNILLSNFYDDMTNAYGNWDYDVMSIRRFDVNYLPANIFNCFSLNYGNLIFERVDKAEEMTLEQVCKALGKRIVIVE